MGYTYDSMEEESQDTLFQHQVMNFSLRQLRQRNWLRHKAVQKQEEGEAYQEQAPNKEAVKDDYGVEEFKDKDDYGVEEFK